MISNYRLIECPHCTNGVATVQYDAATYGQDTCAQCDGHSWLVERTSRDEDGDFSDTFVIGDLM